MSDELLRVLNAPVDDESALARLWKEYTLSHVEDSSEADSDIDSESIDDAPGAVTEGADIELEADGDEFDMLRSDVDVAVERAMALPEYVLQEQEDIVKATAFRFVALHHYESLPLWLCA